MGLTPDGSRLLVANKLDDSIAIIDPDSPSNAQAVTVPFAGNITGGPVFVAATSDGNALISMSGINANWLGPVYELNLSTLQVQALNLPVFTGDGPRLSSTSDGSTILIRPYQGAIGFWNVSAAQYDPVSDNFAGEGIGSAAADGNLFAIGLGFAAPDGSSTIGLGVPDELGGYQSLFPNDAALNDSGSLSSRRRATIWIFSTLSTAVCFAMLHCRIRSTFGKKSLRWISASAYPFERFQRPDGAYWPPLPSPSAQSLLQLSASVVAAWFGSAVAAFRLAPRLPSAGNPPLFRLSM